MIKSLSPLHTINNIYSADRPPAAFRPRYYLCRTNLETANITLESGMFNAIIAPKDIILRGINYDPVLGRYTTLYICGNFHRILSRIDSCSTNFHIQRAFTVHQLLTILQENYHSIVIVEHDPTIYDDAGDVKRVVSLCDDGCLSQCNICFIRPTNGSSPLISDF